MEGLKGIHDVQAAESAPVIGGSANRAKTREDIPGSLGMICQGSSSKQCERRGLFCLECSCVEDTNVFCTEHGQRGKRAMT